MIRATATGTPPTLSHAERDRRWALTRRFLSDNGFDALLVFGLKSRDRYDAWLSNEITEGVVFFPLEGTPAQITWVAKMVTRRMPESIDRSQFWIDDVRVGLFGPSVAELLLERGLASSRIAVIGLDTVEPVNFQGFVPYNVWNTIIRAVPQAVFEDVSKAFGRLILTKSPEEIEILKHAARIGESAATAMFEEIRVGAAETDIYATALDVIHRNSARSVDPHLIMTFGADDVGWDQPVWTYSGGPPRRVRPGDLVNAELFCSYGGLEAQLQLSVAVEPVDPVIRELADVARRCYDAGLELMRPGRTFREVCAAMVGPLQEAGCWNLTPMIHSLMPISWIGDIGIGNDQMPGLSRYPGALRRRPAEPVELVLEPGMVFAFEPNAGRANRRVNIGGTVLVTDGDPLELNDIPNFMRIANA